MTLIRIGYSGTREGMTRPQMLAVYHHIAHTLLVNDNDPDVEGVVHGEGWHHFTEPLDYLARDWNIAYETSELLAAPKTPAPYRGSGTWTTAGYAVELGRPAAVFAPDGSYRPGSSFFGAPLPGRPA